jgi:predicted RecA/RadA family phage recombinase
MAKNFVQDGDVLNYTAGSNLSSGAVVLMGSILGVVLADIASGAVGSVKVTGVFSLAKDTSTEVDAGDQLYWDAANAKLVKDATAGFVFAGIATEDAAEAATTAKVRLGAGGAPKTIREAIAYQIQETVADDSYIIRQKMPYAGTINSVTSKCVSGTATATFKINTTALGGTANSVSSTENSQAHTAANVFAAGDDLVVTISANSTCVRPSFTLDVTRSL